MDLPLRWVYGEDARVDDDEVVTRSRGQQLVVGRELYVRNFLMEVFPEGTFCQDWARGGAATR